MVLMPHRSDMRRWAGRAVLAAALAALGGQAHADAPETTTPQKTQAQKTPAQKTAPAKTATGKPAPTEDAISPRWIGPKWEIKGLTVWVFTPGHFEGR